MIANEVDRLIATINDRNPDVRRSFLFVVVAVSLALTIPWLTYADAGCLTTGQAPPPAPTHTIPTAHYHIRNSAGATERVSVASDSSQSNGLSRYPFVSADGRYVAFQSAADNLVSGDTNWETDVFVHDRETGQTRRVSIASDGTEANGGSGISSLSADGRYVAFASYASNLVSSDTNSVAGIFVRDRETGQTTRVSVASDGSQPNSASSNPFISADGRYVAFYSLASNLVSDDTNSAADIFVRDQVTGQTTRVSVASDGTQANAASWDRPSISAEGRYVAFASDASNLVSGDTNGARDVFLHDRQTGQTTRVSVASDGSQGNGGSGHPSISADGQYVAFVSSASDLVSGDTNGKDDVFVHDREAGKTTRISIASDGSQGNDHCLLWNPSISPNGRYVAFSSRASNLVGGDTNDAWDVFVRDRVIEQTTRVSVASDGTQGDAESKVCSISADGRHVAFDSGASNLVSDDTNQADDIFAHDRGQGEFSTVVIVPLTGGDLTAWGDHTTLTFPPDAFSNTAMITYTGYSPAHHTVPTDLTDLEHFFDLSGVYTDTDQPAQPTQPYTITVYYSEADKGPVTEETLALYYWDGSQWVKEATSAVDEGNNAITAAPDHFSSWAVLGETRRVFLPLVLRQR